MTNKSGSLIRDNFHLLNIGKIVRSTSLGKNEKISARLASKQIQFGFNRKQDNVSKTKQLKLF